MRKHTIAGLMVVFAGTLMAACAPADESGEAETETAAAEPTAAELALPGTDDAADVWAYLGEADYQSWELWPGKGKNYPGGEPHGSTLTTYLNPAAFGAVSGGADGMPAGAIIVKENYMPDGMLGAITTMYKVPGYNADAADWYWVKFMPDGSVDMDGMAQGKVGMCISCHSGKADNDYVMTADLGGQ